jgi:tRNA nucleotidyltransferase/poly(A) polymerase
VKDRPGFLEQSIYSTIPNLIKILIQKDKPTARDYLRKCLQSPSDLELLNYMDQYTLEALILHVLGTLFNALGENAAVRVSTLLEQLDTAVRYQADLLKSRKIGKKTTPTHDDQAKKEISEAEEKGKKKGVGFTNDCRQREMIGMIND